MITLNHVMRANALSSIIFGLIFLFIPAKVAGFLSADMPIPTLVLLTIGGILIFNGLHLTLASLTPNPS